MKAQTQKWFFAVITLLALLCAPVFAQDDYPPNNYPTNQGGDPPDRVARLGYVSGTVSFQPSGEDQWSQAVLNYPLTSGDRIYTDRDGRAELETGNIAVRVSSSTDLTTTSLNNQLVQLGLAQGTLRVRAYDMLSGSSVEIDTPNAALTLLRPGSYRVETYPDENTTLVTVNSGDLEISGNDLSQTLHSGQSVKLTGTDQVQMDFVSALGGDDFDSWCNDRDRRYLSSNSRQYTGDYVPGYDDLDQYGQWQPSPDYGQVWYPSGVAADWAPYRYGRWAWVEPWGWTWVEEEPWGFAPFHYGRWVLIGPRWAWVPGAYVVGVRPIYAPALVAFVGGPSAGVQVWFPLGPRDPFFPWYHHSDLYLRRVNVTNVRVNVNIVNVINVRNVENIHYAYQRVAPTAVSTDVFRGGRPVARETVRVDVNAIARARVIPHPTVQPDAHAIHAGAPEMHPPVERTRPHIENRAPVSAGNRGPAPGSFNRGGPPQNNRTETIHTPPSGEVNRRDVPNDNARTAPAEVPRRDVPNNENEHTLPAQVPRNDVQTNNAGRPGQIDHPAGQPGPGGPPLERGPLVNNQVNAGRPGQIDHPAGQPGPGGPRLERGPLIDNQGNSGRPGQIDHPAGQPGPGGPPLERRPLVTRTPPPPQVPPFSQRQAPLSQDPGRPLEPQQVNNIRRGQPAGPQRDREVPPHQNQQTQSRSRSNSGPPPRSEDRGKDNRDHR
ncbi:MAG TPA: DUF6600 domain-containing protein [Candidatus Angelobacter sp.]|nr:DUF6600 domain-containing protein [Candidatus Angelobacter sp.]